MFTYTIEMMIRGSRNWTELEYTVNLDKINML
jgi:phosphopantetheine adenylyltransferase